MVLIDIVGLISIDKGYNEQLVELVQSYYNICIYLVVFVISQLCIMKFVWYCYKMVNFLGCVMIKIDEVLIFGEFLGFVMEIGLLVVYYMDG